MNSLASKEDKNNMKMVYHNINNIEKKTNVRLNGYSINERYKVNI